MSIASPRLATHEAVHKSVRSSDGARITFTRMGIGPAIVFVHGSLSKGSDWQGVANLLSDRFTCYLMDRRGHGRSGNHDVYSIENEYQDVRAVLEAAGEDACLAGHSFGAICALGAALGRPVPRLVLYEPPLPVGGLIAGEHLAPYCEAVEEGRFSDALALGLERFVRLPKAEVEELRGSRAWPRLASMVPGWERELRAMDELSPSVEQYACIPCSTLLFLGTESADHPFHIATAALKSTLPRVQTVSLAGHRHMGLRSARQTLADQMAGFLLGGQGN